MRHVSSPTRGARDCYVERFQNLLFSKLVRHESQALRGAGGGARNDRQGTRGASHARSLVGQVELSTDGARGNRLVELLSDASMLASDTRKPTRGTRRGDTRDTSERLVSKEEIDALHAWHTR